MGERNGADRGPTSWRWISSRLAAIALVMALLLFLPAGRLTWTGGWLFLLISAVAFWTSVIYLRKANPEIFDARRRIREGTKRWDRILLSFLIPVFLAIFVVAALDAGRFRWSSGPWWGVGLGYVLFGVGFALTAWAQAANRFFEPSVRIQTERGHHVVDTGPYAFVRHPGYVAACLLFAGCALALGSFWALIPAGLDVLLIILRTVLEDRMLLAELPGYQEYSQRVRFRFIPGLW